MPPNSSSAGDAARCTHNISLALSDLGRRAEAVAAVEEARAAYDALGMVRPMADADDSLPIERMGLLLASCAKLASEVIERIQSHQEIRS